MKCPCCKRQPNILALHSYLYVHFCEPTDRWLYSNGKIFSTDSKGVARVERVHVERTPSQDGQVPCQVIPLQRKPKQQDSQNPA